MVEILIVIYVIWFIMKKRKKSGAKTASVSNRPKKTVSAVPNRPRKTASAIPNVPKKLQRSKEEMELEARTRESRKACHYEAAYSKGKPDRIGRRGDYEPAVPNGMVRVRCAYCNADNFVPAGTREHYHCYFCWEKL